MTTRDGLRPAPLPKRVFAGAIDTFVIGVLCVASFTVPMVLRGVSLPMWGVLAVMVGYAVVPLAFLKRTLGMHLFGLELVTKQGHAVDLANLLFRELLGRGFFPAAWMFTIISSLVASYFRVGGSTTPAGLAGVMTFASSAALVVAVIGHVIALGRPDQRTLADLIAGSYVVEGPALPPPTDADEREEADAHRRRVLARIVVFELVLMASVLGLPWLLTSSGGETSQQKIARLKRESLQAKFDQNPGVESLAAELQREYLRAGDEEKARAVFEKHRTARSLREASREESLRAQFAERKDRPSATALIELLEEQDRVDEAAEVYREFLGPQPEAPALVGFGNWLASNRKTEEAVAVLERGLAIDPLAPYGHTILGVCLQRLGKLPEAREHLELALLDDPHDEDAADALAEVEAKVGQLSAADKQRLQRQVSHWRNDAGPTR